MSRFRGSISGQVLRGRGTFGALAPTRKINNSSMVQPMNIREAYGGAITFSLPVSFADVSDVVPVPDNQEVFGDQEGRCLVVEILEAVSDVADQEATRFFWDNLVQENEASRNVVQSWGELSLADVPGVPPGSYKGVVEGVQSVAKGRQGREQIRLLVKVLHRPDQFVCFWQ